MLGLRTKENNKFLEFFKRVQEEAKKKDRVFFMDFGQCKDISFEDMEIDDLFGWLIPLDQVNSFNKEFKENNISDKWDDFIIWCESKLVDGNLKIEFNSYD